MTSSPNRSGLHPIIWVAAVAVIGFSAVGIGAITGLIPSAGGHTEIQTESRMVAADAQREALKPAPTAAAPAEKSTTPKAAAKPEPTRSAPQPVARNPQPAVAACPECGVIESVRSVEVKGQGSAVGVITGGVIGGVLGNQVGKGKGRDLATVGGAVLGGFAGNEVEKKVRSTTRYEVSVRLDSGERKLVQLQQLPKWREGDRVAVRDGGLHAPDARS